MKGGDAFRAEGFEEGALKLHCCDERCDDVNHVAPEVVHRLRDARSITRESIEKPTRQLVRPGIDPHDHRIADSSNRREQTVHEMHESLLPFELD
jgi:hypothetical protein